MAKKAKSKAKAKVSVASYVFLGLMALAAIIAFIGLLITTHFYVDALGKTQTFTLGALAEHFASLNKVPGANFSTAALTCANVFGWIAVAGAIVLVVLEALKIFGVKVPNVVSWILVGVTLAAAVAFIVCAATVCIDFHGSKKLYDAAAEYGKQLSLGAGSYMTVIGSSLVPVLAVAKKMTVK